MIIETIDLAQLRDKVLVVKLGTDDRPATDEDLACFQEDFKKLIDKAGLGFEIKVMVTHHAMEFEVLSQ